jgi:hypothetical protein
MVSGDLGDYFEENMGNDRYAGFFSLFEKNILLEHMLQCETFTQVQMDLIDEYIPLLMDLFKRTINRLEGTGCKFVKYHFLQHLHDDLLRNGSCQNTTSGPGESRHKVACKRPAKNTQRIAAKFENQLGKQYVDALVIDRAAVDIHWHKKPYNAIDRQSIVVNRFVGKRFFF